MLESKSACPFCGHTDRQVKAGLHDGAQRFKCSNCLRRYIHGAAPQSRLNGPRRPVSAASEDSGSKSELVQMNGQGKWSGRTGPRSETSSTDKAANPLHAPDIREITVQSADSPSAQPIRRATIVDVAELAGVSVSTVSNYLNDKGRMGLLTRERIRAAVLGLSFTPNALVSAIRQRRTNILGVVTYGLFDLDSSSGNTGSPAMLSAIASVADANGYNILLYTGWPNRVRTLSGLDSLDGHIDGLIWVGPKVPEPALESVVNAGLPTVVLLGKHVPDSAGYVAADNAGGMKLIMEHLTGLGHRRIAYIGPMDESDFVERFQGYLDGLQRANIPVDSTLIANNSAIDDSWPSRGAPEYEAAIGQWLKLSEPPTAIVSTVDTWAEWIISHLRGLGLRVPEDVAVTGFDDIAAASSINGGITTIRQDFSLAGRTGTKLLINLIGGAPAEKCRVTLPVSIIVRGSTVRLS